MALISRSISLARNVPLLPDRLRAVNSQEMNLKSVRFRDMRCSLMNIEKALNHVGWDFLVLPFVYFSIFKN